MTSTQQGPSGWSAAGSVGEPSGAPFGGDRGDGWWPDRPRRSVADRKIAGVAGGLGRAMGVDPVLFRVGFVVLGFFGIGIPLYLAGWLLLPGDEDQVSPGEALLGRGRSSVPPVAVIAMIIGLAVSLGMTFSFGNVFPLIALGVIAVLVLRRRRRAHGGGWSCGRGGWQHRTGPWNQQWSQQWQGSGSRTDLSNSAQQWAAAQPWGRAAGFTDGRGPDTTGPGPAPSASPFDTPPFWDEPSGASDRVDLTKRGTDPTGTQDHTPDAPPAWDPLGVAPFAWDLPEPAPAGPTPVPVTRDPGVIGRVTTGLAFLVGGALAAGILAGWWGLPWAAVSGGALAVVAVGLLVGSLRGRAQNLIGTGVFLSLVTLGLTVTGLQGTGGYGDQRWAPTTVAAVQSQYEINGGSGTLDLTGITVPAGQTVRTDVEVHAGQASVRLPADAAVDVSCTSNAGEVDCLGERRSGLRQQVDQVQAGAADRGTIELTVHVGAGQAEVRRG